MMVSGIKGFAALFVEKLMKTKNLKKNGLIRRYGSLHKNIKELLSLDIQRESLVS
jgi:hypothetical protein